MEGGPAAKLLTPGKKMRAVREIRSESARIHPSGLDIQHRHCVGYVRRPAVEGPGHGQLSVG